MREIKELQYELREMEGDVRSVRARMIRLVEELERNYVTKSEAKRLMAKGTPTLPSYLLESLELLQADDLLIVEQNLHEAAKLTDGSLLATRADATEPQPLEPASLDPEPLEPSEPEE